MDEIFPTMLRKRLLDEAIAYAIELEREEQETELLAMDEFEANGLAELEEEEDDDDE